MSGSGSSLPKATGSTEGFYRSSSRTGISTSSPLSLTLVSDSITKSVKPETMDRRVDKNHLENPKIKARPGSLRPPGELGRSDIIEEEPIPSTRFHAVGLHPRGALVRKRSAFAIKSSTTQSAAAAAAQSISTIESSTIQGSSQLCAFAYRGVEVLFTAFKKNNHYVIYGICARTRAVFQTLDLPSTSACTGIGIQRTDSPSSPIRVINAVSNSTTGMIAIALSNGVIQTYAPVPADPSVHAFGRYRWINDFHINCKHIFYQPGETACFHEHCISTKAGEAIIMSYAYNTKLLVAHQNQIVVFDTNSNLLLDNINLTTSATTGTTTTANATIGPSPPPKQQNLDEKQHAINKNAQMLWTTTITNKIVTAQISGDGQAIAVVADKEIGERNDENTEEQQCGVQTFIRDKNDGGAFMSDGAKIEDQQSTHSASTTEQSIGILYRHGPFLFHTSNVTRISFRGQGSNISSAVTDDAGQGNDLLLTYCSSDCTARIFNQNSWKQLVEWTTPPNSRVDWVTSIAAFSLGDLETKKRITTTTTKSSNSGYRTPLSHKNGDRFGEDGNSQVHGGNRLSQSALPNQTTPSTAAGAWVSELTFKNAFPAIRFSRLSYLKRGSDSVHPALFESVATILPAGSILSKSVLNNHDGGLIVHGVWPAWNPWLSESPLDHSEETLRGSAMSFLGLSSGPPSSNGANIGDSLLGGTHSPPCEVRIFSSHPSSNNVVIMELPLWADRDIGELELGNVIRYVLSLSDVDLPVLHKIPDNQKQKFTAHRDAEGKHEESITESIHFESDRLVARVNPDLKSVAISWRKQGTLSLLPTSWKHYNDVEHDSALFNLIPPPDYSNVSSSAVVAKRFQDISAMPIPLSLPPLLLPKSAATLPSEKIIAIKWWPDENFGAPPHLLAVTTAGSIILFEIPPPWSSIEPAMPNIDPFLDSSGSFHDFNSAAGSIQGLSDSEDGSETDTLIYPKEYDVMITPHPDFGLGLRLESQVDKLPAVAGSYKKHPLNGGMLPAEKVGMIVLGDELISVNNVVLEGITFDEIISVVREVASASPGKPLAMRFRRIHPGRKFHPANGKDSVNSSIHSLKPKISETLSDKLHQQSLLQHNDSNGQKRRSMEQILGVSPKKELGDASIIVGHHRRTGSKGSVTSLTRKRNNSFSSETGQSLATMLVGADSEVQQEFCRVTAIIPKAVPISRTTLHPLVGSSSSRKYSDSDLSVQSRIILIPWTVGLGAPKPQEHRCVALLFSVEDSKIHAKRLEVAADCNPDEAKIISLGMLDIGNDSSFSSPNNSGTNQNVKKALIQSIHLVATPEEEAKQRYCLAIHENFGAVRFVFVSIEADSKRDNNRASPTLIALFLQHRIFQLYDICKTTPRCLIRASSIDLLATMCHENGAYQTLTVWSARPHPFGESYSLSQKGKMVEGEDLSITATLKSQNKYVSSELKIEHSEGEILDFFFIQTGFLDSYPLLIVLTKKEAIVYQRRGTDLKWKPIIELSYSFLEGSSQINNSPSPSMNTKKLLFGEAEILETGFSTNPLDIYPHLLLAIRTIYSSFDEVEYLRADWHPDSLLAQICTDEGGAKLALKKHVRDIFLRLSSFGTTANQHKDGKEVDDGHMNKRSNSSSVMAVFPNLLFDGIENKNDNANHSKMDEESQVNVSNLFSALKPKRPVVQIQVEEDTDVILLRKLLSALAKVFTTSSNPEKYSHGAINKQFIFEDGKELYSGLHLLNLDELRLLWGLGKLVLDPPEFNKLDIPGQLYLFTMLLFRSIMPPESDKSDTATPTRNEMLGSFRFKTKSARNMNNEERKSPAISSAGCLAALLSDSQEELLDLCRKQKQYSTDDRQMSVDWKFVRETRMPFWVRSDSALANLSEEIGQNIFKKSRNILDCALFFVIARKTRKLRNLAATDQSEKGRMFLKFITNHDFKSDRGRRAAEKNAYSLLRKNRYIQAAAFFLLPDPPIKKSAIEIIATKMCDLDLAFMVARLVESSEVKSDVNSNSFGVDAALGGGGFNLSSFGAVGGYTNPARPIGNNEVNNASFNDWEPNLEGATKTFLLERAIPMTVGDNCSIAVCLLWLKRKEEASWWLTGLSGSVNEKDCSCKIEASIIPQALSRQIKLADKQKWQDSSSKNNIMSSNDRAISKSNSTIGFVSGPLLLKILNASTRSRFASALIVSESLMRCGIDVPSIRTLLHCVDPGDVEKDNAKSDLITISSKSIFQIPKKESKNGYSSENKNNGMANSSIFDSYDVIPPAMHHNVKPSAPSIASGQMNSSIFDSFDSPNLNTTTTSSNATTGTVNSSIFDSYDVPSKVLNSPSSPIGNDTLAGKDRLESSIFDSFNVPKPMLTSSSIASGTTKSSIFISDDVPSKEATLPISSHTNSSGQMESSIFDSFDVTSKKPVPTISARPNDQMESSIFDSFDVPSKKPATTIPARSSGQMESSIFDNYDVPTARRKERNTEAALSTTKSLIVDSYQVNSAKTTKSAIEVNKTSPQIELLLPISSAPIPRLWLELRSHILVCAAARRLIREVASEISGLYGDAFDPPVIDFGCRTNYFIPSSAFEVLQLPCEAESILRSIVSVWKEICRFCDVDQDVVLRFALRFLATPVQHHRLFLAALLNLASGRGDLAEDLVRDASQLLIQKCSAHTFSNDDLLNCRNTLAHASHQHLRRYAARLSWQLELCLWLHRGGGLPLSGIAINEAIVAVRIGLIIASWNQTFECLDTMIKCEPDCLLDAEAGRQLWTSLKMISQSEKNIKSSGGVGSGGWEFLVDCRRSEATEILRSKLTGCFIIRPHAEDHGVFTLSFKTNLVPTDENKSSVGENDSKVKTSSEDPEDQRRRQAPPASGRPIRKDDVVQHAIIRLSDSGFRCGSFGPFGTLMKLLEAVSTSLPFDLRLDMPPAERVIVDEGSQPSPNSVFLRKFVLRHDDGFTSHLPATDLDEVSKANSSIVNQKALSEERSVNLRKKRLGLFFDLLVLSTIRNQLSSVVSAEYENSADLNKKDLQSIKSSQEMMLSNDDTESDVTSMSGTIEEFGCQYSVASRILRPFLIWCRTLEICCEYELTPPLLEVSPKVIEAPQITLSASETAIEATDVNCGDSLIRCMIQPNSGVEFRTLKLSDGTENTLVILFSKKEAKNWLQNWMSEKSIEGAVSKLDLMERKRVIEPIDLGKLQLKAYTTATSKDASVEEMGVRYRFVDPWEVEALDSREGETKSAAIGRERFLAFSLGRVATDCENIFRSLGGQSLLELWATTKGGIALTKAIASVHPTWERGAGGDLLLVDGGNMEPSPFMNSVRQHLYRNCLYRRLSLPQRFLALIQVELLDLKNLTAPGGSSSLTVYALLRLRRSDSRAPLTGKTRTLDSAATLPMKLAKSSGPNAPASWGSVVRFRFPLPEDVSCDGVSLNRDREMLFEGPPCILQVSVYEKKLLHDNSLGDADVKIDGLAAGGQLEEWVPLRAEKSGIHWFARIRLTLRFELMCLGNDDAGSLAPSAGLRRIQQLSRIGGAHEDIRKSASTPDFMSYIESMVY